MEVLLKNADILIEKNMLYVFNVWRLFLSKKQAMMQRDMPKGEHWILLNNSYIGLCL